MNNESGSTQWSSVAIVNITQRKTSGHYMTLDGNTKHHL